MSLTHVIIRGYCKSLGASCLSEILVSVLVPAFNRDKFIGRCLRSLLCQQFDRRSFEIIVIDDGSEDNTAGQVSGLQVCGDEQLKLVKNKSNLGLPASLNVGLELASGKYVTRVDSDDYVNRYFLLFLYEFLEQNQSGRAVACDYLKVNSFEQVTATVNCQEQPIGCGIMFYREDMVAIGGYDERFRLHEDKEFRQRFEFEIHRLAVPLYRYKAHESNMTKDHELSAKFMRKLGCGFEGSDR
jgi:glycosyltransferase involved in cell wall biosynthesis